MRWVQAGSIRYVPGVLHSCAPSLAYNWGTYLQRAHGELCLLSLLSSAPAAAAALLVLDDIVNLGNLTRPQEPRKPGSQQVCACTARKSRLRPCKAPSTLQQATYCSKLLYDADVLCNFMQTNTHGRTQSEAALSCDDRLTVYSRLVETVECTS